MNKLIVSSLFWVGCERLVQIVALVLVNAILVRNLSVNNLSDWQYAFSLSGVLMALTWLCGAEVVMPRVIGASVVESEKIFSQAFIFRVSVTLVVACGVLIYSVFQASAIIKYYCMGFSISVLVREPLMIGYVKLQCEGLLSSGAKILIVGVFLRILTLYILISYGFDPRLIWLPWVVENVFVGVVVFVVSRVDISKKYIHIDKYFYELVTSGIVIWCSLVISILYLKFDKIALNVVSILPVDYSIYAIASQLNENILTLSNVLLQVLVPMYLYKTLLVRVLINRSAKLFVWLFVVLSVVSVFLYFIFHYFIASVYGNNFLGAEKYSQCLVFMLPLWACDAVLVSTLLRLKKPWIILLKWLVAFLMMYIVVTLFPHFANKFVLQIYALYVGIFSSVLFSMVSIFLVVRSKIDAVIGDSSYSRS